jgi:hypothetical protein
MLHFQPMSQLYCTIRAFLELLYFASGIAIAIAAFLGLRQLKIGLEQVAISKEVARTNAKRESVRYAADQCRYFAEEMVPALAKLGTEYQRLGLTFLNTLAPDNQGPRQFMVQKGEIVPARGYDLSLLDRDWPKIAGPVVTYLNACESFAIPFAEGVADEDIGYRETARAFCQGIQECLPAIFQLRRTNQARYESTIKLHTMWSGRLTAEAVAPVIGILGDIVRNAGRDRIPPIGPNF